MLGSVFYGCSSTPKTEPTIGDKIWTGKQKKDLIKEWGLPSRSEADGNGGEVLFYTKKAKAKVYGSSDTKEIEQTDKVFVDSSGRIYNTQRSDTSL